MVLGANILWCKVVLGLVSWNYVVNVSYVSDLARVVVPGDFHCGVI